MRAFAILFWVGVGLWVVSMLALLVEVAMNEPPILFGLTFSLSSYVAIATWILFLIKLHRAWLMVQPLRAIDAHMPTPARAIGFLFIPFFNFYWMFVATAGLIQRVNQLLHDRLNDNRSFNESVPLAYCATVIGATVVFSFGMVGVVPGEALGVLALLGLTGVSLTIYLFVRQLTQAINALLA